MLKSGKSKLSIAVIFFFGLFYFAHLSFSSFLQPEWSSQDQTINYVAAQTVDNNTASQKAQLGQSTTAPKLTGRVVDNANLLSADQKTRLVEKLKAYEDKSSDQIVVLTINSLNDENLEEYANKTFREWGLGQAEENNGVLLLIAKNDRKLRIEVGYGLEGELTDAASSLIINNIIVPEFKKGNFGKGILSGADMIVSVLSGNSAELESRAKRNKKSSKDADPFVYIFITIWILLFFGPFLFSFLAYMFGEKLGPGHYKWLGIEIKPGSSSGGSRGGSSGGWSSGGGGGGFSGGGGSSGGGGASGGW